IQVAFELAAALPQIDSRISPEAIAVLQTGRGAYVKVNIEPQPLTARPALRDALKALANVVAKCGATARIDTVVHDAPRLLRLAGTINHKPDADPSTPAWMLRPWVPSARVPFAAIERLAVPARPKLRMLPGGRPRRQNRTPSRPLRELFAVRGWLYRER